MLCFYPQDLPHTHTEIAFGNFCWLLFCNESLLVGPSAVGAKRPAVLSVVWTSRPLRDQIAAVCFDPDLALCGTIYFRFVSLARLGSAWFEGHLNVFWPALLLSLTLGLRFSRVGRGLRRWSG